VLVVEKRSGPGTPHSTEKHSGFFAFVKAIPAVLGGTNAALDGNLFLGISKTQKRKSQIEC